MVLHKLAKLTYLNICKDLVEGCFLYFRMFMKSGDKFSRSYRGILAVKIPSSETLGCFTEFCFVLRPGHLVFKAIS